MDRHDEANSSFFRDSGNAPKIFNCQVLRCSCRDYDSLFSNLSNIVTFFFQFVETEVTKHMPVLYHAVKYRKVHPKQVTKAQRWSKVTALPFL